MPARAQARAGFFCLTAAHVADPVAQYLERHAEREIELSSALERSWPHVVVVPAHDEQPAMVELVLGAAGRAGALAIVVVNATDSAPASTHAANAELLEFLANRPSVLAIDRASPGRRLPEGQGVGLARKIGCDVALAAHVAGAIESPWIHSTDADVSLPGDYFDAVAKTPAGCAALVYRFSHDTPESEVGRALRLYEASLRYYVLGLDYAGSPYAFHTIGSALAARADAYAKVRGVPQRRGGEDFYLLNKLAKVGRVWRAGSEPIHIAARLSERVPFGTGPATKRIAAAHRAGEPFRVYHPGSFACIGEAIRWIERGERASADTERAMDMLGAPAAVAKARSDTTTERAFVTRMRQWLDAFRTLKLIHSLRDAGLEMLPLHDALTAAPFCPSDVEGLEIAETRLAPAPRPVAAEPNERA